MLQPIKFRTPNTGWKILSYFLSFTMFLGLGVLVSCSSDIETNLPVIPGDSTNQQDDEPEPPELLITGLEGASGSTIGPDGALYIAEGAAGRISRIDLESGERSTFASGLPTSLIGIGGVYDLVFFEDTAYALVTLVSEEVGGADVDGIYRIDGENSFTIIADIGKYSSENLPEGDIDLKHGLQYAIEVFEDGFLVTDGHHNRLLKVTTEGDISNYRVFDNIVPTGLSVAEDPWWGDVIYMAEAGPTPHLPEDGKVIAIWPDYDTITETASGAPLLVDVEVSKEYLIFALAQGIWEEGDPGAPASENTGSLVVANQDGTFTVVANDLDRPTSIEITGDTAYIVNMVGEVWSIPNISSVVNN